MCNEPRYGSKCAFHESEKINICEKCTKRYEIHRLHSRTIIVNSNYVFFYETGEKCIQANPSGDGRT